MITWSLMKLFVGSILFFFGMSELVAFDWNVPFYVRAAIVFVGVFLMITGLQKSDTDY